LYRAPGAPRHLERAVTGVDMHGCRSGSTDLNQSSLALGPVENPERAREIVWDSVVDSQMHVTIGISVFLRFHVLGAVQSVQRRRLPSRVAAGPAYPGTRSRRSEISEPPTVLRTTLGVPARRGCLRPSQPGTQDTTLRVEHGPVQCGGRSGDLRPAENGLALGRRIFGSQAGPPTLPWPGTTTPRKLPKPTLSPSTPTPADDGRLHSPAVAHESTSSAGPSQVGGLPETCGVRPRTAGVLCRDGGYGRDIETITELHVSPPGTWSPTENPAAGET